MFKTLLKSVREYKLPAILSPIFVMLETALECIIPFVTAKLIDNLYAKEMGQIYILAVILFSLAVLALTFGFFAARFTAVASAGFAKNLRQDAFDNIQNFSFSNIDKFSDRKSTRLNSSHTQKSRMPSSA